MNVSKAEKKRMRMMKYGVIGELMTPEPDSSDEWDADSAHVLS